MKDLKPHIQESLQTPLKTSTKKTAPQHNQEQKNKYHRLNKKTTFSFQRLPRKAKWSCLLNKIPIFTVPLIYTILYTAVRLILNF